MLGILRVKRTGVTEGPIKMHKNQLRNVRR